MAPNDLKWAKNDLWAKVSEFLSNSAIKTQKTQKFWALWSLWCVSLQYNEKTLCCTRKVSFFLLPPLTIVLPWVLKPRFCFRKHCRFVNLGLYLAPEPLSTTDPINSVGMIPNDFMPAMTEVISQAWHWVCALQYTVSKSIWDLQACI